MSNIDKILLDVQIEKAENKIREEHNEIESKRIIGKKHYMPYDSSKFIQMIKFVMEK